jgi:hypothetical protein
VRSSDIHTVTVPQRYQVCMHMFVNSGVCASIFRTTPTAHTVVGLSHFRTPYASYGPDYVGRCIQRRRKKRFDPTSEGVYNIRRTVHPIMIDSRPQLIPSGNQHIAFCWQYRFLPPSSYQNCVSSLITDMCKICASFSAVAFYC